MPRILRHIVPGAPLHVVKRGHNRANVFTDDIDRFRFLEFMSEASLSTRCTIHAYVLMDNHFHCLITPPDSDAASDFARILTGHYAQFFNWRHGRCGTLWQGRYYSRAVTNPPYLVACSRYIEDNPVRANMVSTPRAYRWSSHAANAYGQLDALITRHPLFETLSETVEGRYAAYRTLFDTVLDPVTMGAIRARHVRHGVRS